MYCPNCHQKISGRVSTCPFCGAYTGVPQSRGGGMLAALLIWAVLATWQINGAPARDISQYLHSEESAASGTVENPPRGTTQQVKEGDLGSAGYLRGDVMLVSLYISDEGGVWDEEKEANAQSYIKVACDFLEEEAASYDQELELIYDVNECPELMYHVEYDRRASEDEYGHFTRWLYRWIDENVPVAYLQAMYGTDNVGFLALVADEGGAYTNVYYIEDSTKYFNENSVLFYYYTYVRTKDREVPAVYAHEILHMFGAIDLYEESPDFSPENIAYVAETYPDDIMYSDYWDDGRLNYESIHLSISPVTAYYLGWIDELPEEDQEGLTDYERVCVAGFSYDDPTFYEDEEEE